MNDCQWAGSVMVVLVYYFMLLLHFYIIVKILLESPSWNMFTAYLHECLFAVVKQSHLTFFDRKSWVIFAIFIYCRVFFYLVLLHITSHSSAKFSDDSQIISQHVFLYHRIILIFFWFRSVVITGLVFSIWFEYSFHVKRFTK